MRLPQILDIAAAGPLHAELLRARGSAVAIDASDVERVGGLCFQILLSAQATWAADGQPFEIANASPAFIETARVLAASELCSPRSVG